MVGTLSKSVSISTPSGNDRAPKEPAGFRQPAPKSHRERIEIFNPLSLAWFVEYAELSAADDVVMKPMMLLDCIQLKFPCRKSSAGAFGKCWLRNLAKSGSWRL